MPKPWRCAALWLRPPLTQLYLSATSLHPPPPRAPAPVAPQTLQPSVDRCPAAETLVPPASSSAEPRARLRPLRAPHPQPDVAAVPLRPPSPGAAHAAARTCPQRRDRAAAREWRPGAWVNQHPPGRPPRTARPAAGARRPAASAGPRRSEHPLCCPCALRCHSPAHQHQPPPPRCQLSTAR